MPTDADTEAGRGEGRDAFEVELRDLAERMLDRGKENEGNAVMVMADKLERLRQSDPGALVIVCTCGEEYPLDMDDVLPWVNIGAGAEGLFCQRCDTQLAYRDPAAPTDEAPEKELPGRHGGTHRPGTASYTPQPASPPVEEGERGELQPLVDAVLDGIHAGSSAVGVDGSAISRAESAFNEILRRLRAPQGEGERDDGN